MTPSDTTRAAPAAPASGRFDPLARALHWAMALMILAMLFVGAGMVASLSGRPWLLDLHRPLGIAILVLAVLRLGHRLRHAPPPLPASLPRWQHWAAHASHWVLYGLMLAMPLLGWAMLSAAGDPVRMAGDWVLPPIAPQDPALHAALRWAHGALGYALFATILVHVSAALRHAWVLRDGVFQAMAPVATAVDRHAPDASLPVLEFAHAVFRDGRNTTVRRGTRWSGVPAARLRLADGSLSPPVALETEQRVFRDLDEPALRFEHDPACRTPAGLFAQLAIHYPGFREDEVVTLCHFDR